MNLRNLLLLACCSLAVVACDNDDDDGAAPCTVEGGELSGGPFAFTVDGLPDAVGDITLSGASGANMVYLVTDEDGTILGITASLEGVQGIDFDANDPGTCRIYHLSFQRDLVGADVGRNLDELDGCHDLSNALDVVRSPCGAVGGTLEGGPFTFAVDGDEDRIGDGELTLAGAEGDSTGYVITTGDSTSIIAAGAEFGDLDEVDFDAFAADTFLVWALTRNSEVVGGTPGTSPADLSGCVALSTAVQVFQTCSADAAELEGGPFTFQIDGESDFIPAGAITTSGGVSESTTFVVTDDAGNILGLPPTLEAVSTVDFNAAGAGTCLVWQLNYSGTVSGADAGANASELGGCFELSNPLTVNRVCAADGGRLQGGPFEITVDSIPDFIDVSQLVLSGADGETMTYVVTDSAATILGLPADLEALGNVDFNRAGVGTCLIWHLSYDGEITGAETGESALDLGGCYDLSNSVEVVRSAP